MDSRQAREALRLYRPGTTDAMDPQVAEALDLAQRDAELGQWLEEQRAVYLALRGKLKQIEVPPDLKRNILLANVGRSKVVSLGAYRGWLAAAAAIMLLAGALWFLTTPRPQNTFSSYRDRMARMAQRGYAMEMTSTDLNVIREYLRSKDSYADYTLTKGLEKLAGEGSAATFWHGKKVAMVCFNAGGKKSLYLFVARRADMPNAPLPGQTEFNPVYKFMTASWSTGDKVYVLAGPGEAADLQPYLN